MIILVLALFFQAGIFGHYAYKFCVGVQKISFIRKRKSVPVRTIETTQEEAMEIHELENFLGTNRPQIVWK